LVGNAIRRIEFAEFLPQQRYPFPPKSLHELSIRRPVSGATANDRGSLVRRPGTEDFGWIDELNH
jgi:hypothetical protein